jgi:hypothetical protein
VYFGGFGCGLTGAILWVLGWGSGACHESAVATMTPAARRELPSDLQYEFGRVFWFIGSAVMGTVHDHSITGLVLFSTIIQIAALPLLYAVVRATHRKDRIARNWLAEERK